MKFATPLITGTLIQRHKRFLADVALTSGETVTATCPNTGSMLGLTTPGLTVWLSTSDSPTRKYRYTWEMISVPSRERKKRSETLVGINTGHPNALVTEAIGDGTVQELAGYSTLRREVKYGKSSRIDILLDGKAGAPPCYVEIKNVHLMRHAGLAEFPDSRTERGVKHLHELSDMVRGGARAVMLYLVQRADADRFSVASDIDPAYAAALKAARQAGVETLCYRCDLSPTEIRVTRSVALDLD